MLQYNKKINLTLHGVDNIQCIHVMTLLAVDGLTLKAPTKIAADDILIFYIFISRRK